MKGTVTNARHTVATSKKKPRKGNAASKHKDGEAVPVRVERALPRGVKANWSAGGLRHGDNAADDRVQRPSTPRKAKAPRAVPPLSKLRGPIDYQIPAWPAFEGNKFHNLSLNRTVEVEAAFWKPELLKFVIAIAGLAVAGFILGSLALAVAGIVGFLLGVISHV